MLTITISNSTTQIDGLTTQQYRSLRRVLSYKVQGSFFSGDPTGGVRYLLTKRGECPTGLLGRVSEWVRESRLPTQWTDLRKPPKAKLGLFKAKLQYTPYEVQLKAADACRSKGRGIVVAPTGCGKSVMIALTINAMQLPTLVVVPSLELKRQLTQSLSETFGKAKVGGLGKPIAVMNVQSLDPKKPLKGYDVVIIDEYHHSAAKSYRDLNKYAWTEVYHRFGFTATPYRADEEEQCLLESILAKIIYQVPYKLAVERGHIAPIEAYYYEVPRSEVSGNTWARVYKELVVNNDRRNALIATLLQSMRYAGVSALCLVKEVAHGGVLANNIPFAHGENEETATLIKTFNKGSSCLVATTGVCGEGVDTKPCEFMILAGLGKSRPALMQAFGRVFRTYPGKESGKIIIFYDKSHKWTKAHFKEQVRILREEYGVTPIKISIDD